MNEFTFSIKDDGLFIHKQIADSRSCTQYMTKIYVSDIKIYHYCIGRIRKGSENIFEVRQRAIFVPGVANVHRYGNRLPLSGPYVCLPPKL